MAGLVAAGFEVLDLAALSLAVVRIKWHQVHCPDAAEPTSVTKTPEHYAAKPNEGKAMGLLMPFLADTTINQFRE